MCPNRNLTIKVYTIFDTEYLYYAVTHCEGPTSSYNFCAAAS